MRLLVLLLALLLPTAASAGDRELLTAKQRYLAPAQVRHADTPDGAQARYEAGRNLVEAVVAAGRVSAGKRTLRADLLARGRSQVAKAEALDRDPGFRSAAPLAPLPGVGPGYAPGRRDKALDAAPRRRSAQGERRGRDLGARAGLGPLRGLPGRHPVRGRLDGEARRARRRAAGLAAARTKPLVVRRAPDRLLVVEPRRQPARGRARLRRRERRPAPARDALEHLSRPVPRDDGGASARPAHARDDRARPRPGARAAARGGARARLGAPRARARPAAGGDRAAGARVRPAGRRQRRGCCGRGSAA